MKSYKVIPFSLSFIAMLSLFITSCQKMERPPLRPVILDPTPPPYNPLKSLWAFENNLNDEGESKFTATASNLTYTAGIAGQAMKVGANGYLLLRGVGDTVKYPNEFVGVPLDTLKNLGSFTISFWMNGAGPVIGGAQGLFAISHSTEFWGNLELFLENNDNGSEAFLKIHMFNAGVASGNGEEWSDIKLPNALNKWSHLALTYDAATSKLNLYFDGQPTTIANKTLGGGNYGKLKFNNASGMVIGSFAFQTTPSLTNHGPETWAKSFNGAIDQFRLYNKAMTAAEVTDIFTNKK